MRKAIPLGPPPTPNRGTWPYKGSLIFAGMPIYIENPIGSTRSGVAEDGKRWSTTMRRAHYGEFAETLGSDGDPLDVFVGPDLEAPNAYVIRQVDLKGNFDELKVMLGFRTGAEAKAGYLANYDRPDFFGSMTTWPIPKFREWLRRRGPRKDVGRMTPHMRDRILIKAKPRKGINRARVWKLLQEAGGKPIPDEKMHALAEEMGVDPHDLEAYVYSLASKWALRKAGVTAGVAAPLVPQSLEGTTSEALEQGQGSRERIPGGKAAGKSPEDFDPKALAEGTEHELEHTKDRGVAREIAMDHLAEDPEYYRKLRKMEKGGGWRILIKAAQGPELAYRRALEAALATGRHEEIKEFARPWEQLAEKHATELLEGNQLREFDEYLDQRDQLAGLVVDEDRRADLGMVTLTAKNGVRFETGTPVIFRFARHMERADRQFLSASMSGEDLQPAGHILFHLVDVAGVKPQTWEVGEASFRNPLVIEWGTAGPEPEGWKARLSRRFGGTKGAELSKRIRLVGHDGVVTVRTPWGETGEIIDLRRMSSLEKGRSGLRAVFRWLQKAVTPGRGWESIPRGKHGGYRRRAAGGGYEYWYPHGQAGGQVHMFAHHEPEEEAKPFGNLAEARAWVKEQAEKQGPKFFQSDAYKRHSKDIHRLQMEAMKKPRAEAKPKEKPKKVEKEESTKKPMKIGVRKPTPKAEREFVDVGERIGGARKHTWRPRDGVNSDNLRDVEATGEADRHVVKGKVFGKYDHTKDQEIGSTPGASYLKSKIIAAVASGPDKTTGENGRALYVEGAEWLKHELDQAHTMGEVASFVNGWRLMAEGHMVEHTKKMSKEEAIKHLGLKVGYQHEEWSGGGTLYLYPSSPGDTREDRDRKRTEIPYSILKAKGYSTEIVRYSDGSVSFTKQIPKEENVYLRYLFALSGTGAKSTERQIRGNRLVRIVQGEKWRKGAFHQKDVPHARTLEKEPEDSWKRLTGKKERRKGRRWTRAVTANKRIGGPEVSGEFTGERLMKEFGFRGVQYGNWVDDASAAEHVQRAHESFVDLADIMGVDPRSITNGGALAIAFGARGKGNYSAHYESQKVVINLTHTQGNGSIAHEWAHFFDNQMTTAPAQAVVEIGKRGAQKPRGRYTSAGDLADIHPEVEQAFQGVMGTMLGEDRSPEKVALQKRRRTLSNEMNKFNAERHSMDRDAYSRRYLELQRANSDLRNDERTYNHQRMDKPKPQKTDFAKESAAMGDYWASPHEMFARAFECYVEDTLRDKGRANTYLVYGTRVPAPTEHDPFPRSEERKAINKAMDGLMAAMRKHQVLKKAMERILVRMSNRL